MTTEERHNRKVGFAFIPVARITGEVEDKSILRMTRDPGFWIMMRRRRLITVWRWTQQFYWRWKWQRQTKLKWWSEV